ncbi:MAG: hypothetical protein WDN01_14100 [Rhizomicrobium sp.]
MPLHLFVTDDPNHDPNRPDLDRGRRCERGIRAPTDGTVEVTLLQPAICAPGAVTA